MCVCVYRCVSLRECYLGDGPMQSEQGVHHSDILTLAVGQRTNHLAGFSLCAQLHKHTHTHKQRSANKVVKQTEATHRDV